MHYVFDVTKGRILITNFHPEIFDNRTSTLFDVICTLFPLITKLINHHICSYKNPVQKSGQIAIDVNLAEKMLKI